MKKTDKIWATRDEAISHLAASNQRLNPNSNSVAIIALLFNSKPETIIASAEKAREKAKQPVVTAPVVAVEDPATMTEEELEKATAPSAEEVVAQQAAELAAKVDAELAAQ